MKKIFVLALLLTMFWGNAANCEQVQYVDITSWNNCLASRINEDRIAYGVAPIRVDSQLSLAAKLKAEDMVRNGYFAHTSPQGLTPWHWFTQVEYRYDYAGENLALGFSTANGTHYAFMRSPSHRANILNKKYCDIGIYTTYTLEGKVLVVEEFGCRR